jgi:hypothetical protein
MAIVRVALPAGKESSKGFVYPLAYMYLQTEEARMGDIVEIEMLNEEDPTSVVRVTVNRKEISKTEYIIYSMWDL